MKKSSVKVNPEKKVLKRKRKSSKSVEKKKKLSTEEVSQENGEKCESSEVPLVRDSDHPVSKKVKWTNKQRVLIFASRGITYRDRHLMEDLRTLMPHSKPDSKKDNKDDLQIITEIAEMKNCNKCIYFETKKRKDLYMWMANISKGPSIKFLVQNIHSMKELKLTGNSLKGSRPLICFDTKFNTPHWILIKELISQIFNSPKGHPKTQPFFDHVFVFSLVDQKVWFRNYQIVEEDGQLTEIGPRFVLNPVKVFEGSFGGMTLWSNPNYVSPNQSRSDKRKEVSMKYIDSVSQKTLRATRATEVSFIGDPTAEFFVTKSPEEAKGKKKKKPFARKRGGKPKKE